MTYHNTEGGFKVGNEMRKLLLTMAMSMLASCSVMNDVWASSAREWAPSDCYGYARERGVGAREDILRNRGLMLNGLSELVRNGETTFPVCAATEEDIGVRLDDDGKHIAELLTTVLLRLPIKGESSAEPDTNLLRGIYYTKAVNMLEAFHLFLLLSLSEQSCGLKGEYELFASAIHKDELTCQFVEQMLEDPRVDLSPLSDRFKQWVEDGVTDEARESIEFRLRQHPVQETFACSMGFVLKSLYETQHSIR